MRNGAKAYRQSIANPPHPTATAAENTAAKPTYLTRYRARASPKAAIIAMRSFTQ
jgi:hypothetical protein